MQTSFTLPVELINAVVCSLSNHGDLSSCSLVSRAWRRGSQGRLLRNIDIDPAKCTLRSFLDFVASTDAQRNRTPFELPPLSTIVHTIRIVHSNLHGGLDESPRVSLADLRDVLQTLPQLKTVALGGIKLQDLNYVREMDDGVRLEPSTALRRLTLEDITLTYSELLNFFSLFQRTEQLQLSGIRRHSFDDTPDGAFSELEPTNPLFPSAFQGCRSLSARHCDLPFLLHFLTQVLRKAKEEGPEHATERRGDSGLTQVSFSDTFPWPQSFEQEFGDDIRDLHIDLGVWRGTEMNEIGRIRSMNFSAFHSLCTLVLSASLSRYGGTPATLFLAITELIGNSPKTLTEIALHLTLDRRQLPNSSSALALLRGLNTELGWMRTLPRSLPKLQKFRWNWVIDCDMTQEGKRRALETLDNGVRERLHELEEIGLLRFGPDEVWFV